MALGVHVVSKKLEGPVAPSPRSSCYLPKSKNKKALARSRTTQKASVDSVQKDTMNWSPPTAAGFADGVLAGVVDAWGKGGMRLLAGAGSPEHPVLVVAKAKQG